MTEASGPPEYLGERIRQALASDPRVGELDMHVTVASEHVLVTGNVASPERRQAVTEVLAELDLGLDIHNATTIMEFPEPLTDEDVT